MPCEDEDLEYVGYFYLADANSDGYLDPGEFRAVWPTEAFVEYDLNFDGRLDLDEFI